MQAFLTDGDGTATLADAVQHWHRTRSAPPREIDVRCELNRFTRTWRAGVGREPLSGRAAS